MENQKFARIEGDIFWYFGNRVNEMSGKYQFDLCNLSDKAVEWLQTQGISVKSREDKPEQGRYVTFKSVKYPFTPLDTTGQTLEGVTEIGNGSRAIVVTGVYPWEFRKQKGFSPSCKKLIIKELVEYEGKSDEPKTLMEMESDIL